MTLEKIIKTHSIFKDVAWIILKKKDINIPFKYKTLRFVNIIMMMKSIQIS